MKGFHIQKVVILKFYTFSPIKIILLFNKIIQNIEKDFDYIIF